MTLVMVQLIERALTPVCIAVVLLLTWRDGRRILVALSALALGLECVNLVIYFLQVARILPFATSTHLPLADVMRALVSGIAVYAAIAAWALGLALAAQARQFVWLSVILAAAIISMASRTLSENPLAFSRQGFSITVDFLLVLAGILVAVITLIYGLRVRGGGNPAVSTLTQATISAPPLTTDR